MKGVNENRQAFKENFLCEVDRVRGPPRTEMGKVISTDAGF